MQIKLFSIPAHGGEALNEEMNSFLRSKKILGVESHFANEPSGSYWSFCVRYVENIVAAERDKPRVDYREVLGEAAFARFAALRAIRKRIAGEENLPAYIIFTDEELAELAKMETITEAAMRGVKGIGDKKMEKYAQRFLTKPADEKS